MIDFCSVQHVIVKGLQDYLEKYNCPVVLANQTAPAPEYPYVSFTVLSLAASDDLYYIEAEDNSKYKDIQQTWSFTVHSDTSSECAAIVCEVYDWFSEIGRIYHSDNDIVVGSVGNITNRDSLLTIEYEYKNGLDVTFILRNKLSKSNVSLAGHIETVDISYKANYESQKTKEDNIEC